MGVSAWELISGTIAGAYILCAILAVGFYYGSHRKARYNWLPPRHSLAFLAAISGPIGLISMILTIMDMHEEMYFSLFPMTKEESWKVWIERGWGDSAEDREEFERWYVKR